MPPAPRLAATELLAPVATHAAALGFSALGPPSTIQARLPIQTTPRTCYGLAFAFGAQATLGLHGKQGLRFRTSFAIGSGDASDARAEPVVDAEDRELHANGD